ncbi:MAG: hypothetical protein ABI615_07905 [Chthoniobacterales bacterium]
MKNLIVIAIIGIACVAIKFLFFPSYTPKPAPAAASVENSKSRSEAWYKSQQKAAIGIPITHSMQRPTSGIKLLSSQPSPTATPPR